MRKFIFTGFTLIALCVQGQTFIQTYQNRVDQITQQNINTYLQEFEALGVKRTGSVANNNTRDWIKAKYLSFGYQPAQIVEDPFSFTDYYGNTLNSKNLILTKTGAVYPNTYVIICGHYDSIVGPGVNDNGSGTSIILEMARILKDVPTDYSIRFINFSGEEQGLYGSEHYVNAVVNGTTPKMDIKLVFNIDEVGGKKGKTNNTIYCDRDQSAPNSNNAASAQITQELANCTHLYSPLQTAYDPAEASDYMPFQDNGEVITGFYEYLPNNTPHTVDDTYANVDTEYVFNVAKAALGAAQHFAKASQTLGLAENNLAQDFSIYPNPAHEVLHLRFSQKDIKDYSFEITEMTGKLLKLVKNQKEISLSGLNAGTYVGTFRSDGKIISRKFIVK